MDLFFPSLSELYIYGFLAFPPLFTRFLSFPGPRLCVLSPESTNMCSAGRLSIVNHMFRLLTCSHKLRVHTAPRNVCRAGIIQTFVNETAAGEIPRDRPLIKMPLSVCAMFLLFKHTKHSFSQLFFPPSCPSRSGDDECLYRNCV